MCGVELRLDVLNSVTVWDGRGISPRSFALEHDSPVNPTQNPEEIITDY
jgi:hypothetical protein